MSALSDLREKLARSKQYREAFTASVVKRMIPTQIRALRKQHEYTQVQLAKESDLTQGVISRAEDPDYGNLTVNTLVHIAGGFDCAFVGRFVAFSELAKWYVSIGDEQQLRVPSFSEDHGFIERKEPQTAASALTAAGEYEVAGESTTGAGDTRRVSGGHLITANQEVLDFEQTAGVISISDNKGLGYQFSAPNSDTDLYSRAEGA